MIGPTQEEATVIAAEKSRSYPSFTIAGIRDDPLVDFVVPEAAGLAALDECKELGISVVWLQPGADKPSVVEKAHALDLHVIQDCVLVQLP